MAAPSSPSTVRLVWKPRTGQAGPPACPLVTRSSKRLSAGAVDVAATSNNEPFVSAWQPLAEWMNVTVRSALADVGVQLRRRRLHHGITSPLTDRTRRHRTPRRRPVRAGRVRIDGGDCWRTRRSPGCNGGTWPPTASTDGADHVRQQRNVTGLQTMRRTIACALPTNWWCFHNSGSSMRALPPPTWPMPARLVNCW